MDWETYCAELPEGPAVFAIFAREGAPYIARTTRLRRSLKRLLGAGRLISLRAVADRVEYRTCGSQLELALTFYEWCRRLTPDDWEKRVRLRYPSWVKLILTNDFPRTQVTSRLGQGSSSYFGPFRSRAQAELFEAQFLDLFQVRRCVEDLDPTPAHPGCAYGEMNLCARPCQQVVSRDEYRSEVNRAAAFLLTRGQTLLESVAAARERASEAMDFEEAQRQHRRYEKVQGVTKLADEICREVSHLCGVAVLPSSATGEVELRFLVSGCWLPAEPFPLRGAGDSLDARLRRVVAAIGELPLDTTARQDDCAHLARWFYSSWRDGEWVMFESLESVPYRKLVRAINSVAQPLVALSSANSPSPPAVP